jgi:hypothetical protein
VSGYLNGSPLLNGTAFERGGLVLVDRTLPEDSFEPQPEAPADFRQRVRLAALRVLLAIDTNTRAADSLGISPQRLSRHVERYAAKLGLDNGRTAHRAACAERAKRVWQQRKANP